MAYRASGFKSKGSGAKVSGLVVYKSCLQELYSRSPKVGNPIASILKSNVQGIPALFGLNPVSNFMGFTVGVYSFGLGDSGFWFRMASSSLGYDYDSTYWLVVGHGFRGEGLLRFRLGVGSRGLRA